jgi:hypothetical protein
MSDFGANDPLLGSILCNHCATRIFNGLSNRLSGVRLSPGPPLLPIQFHQVDSAGAIPKSALKQCSVIKVSYSFALLHVIERSQGDLLRLELLGVSEDT